MRLRSLTLDRFGHFTDRTFDFGAAGDRPDFHIVYGPNEAGKTTTMAAALRLFYGFDAREDYAFRHQRANLQVSATLDIDGIAQQFVRLPKRNGSLLDGAGSPLPETALTTHLGGLSGDDYRKLLCLDDETIERGGEEIAQAKGDIGRLLFSAAAGVADLSTVLDSARRDADAIWLKRARKTDLAELKRQLADVEKHLRDSDITASGWRALKKGRDTARDAEATARQDRDALQQRASLIAIKRRTLPLLTQLDAIEDQIAPFTAFPDRLDFDPEKLVPLLTEEATLQAEIARLTGEIVTLTDKQAKQQPLAGPEDLDNRLAELDDLRSRDRTATLDLPRRDQTQRDAQAAMRRAANDLGLPETVDPTSIAVPAADLARLDTARDAVLSARAAAMTATQETATVTAQLADARGRLPDATPDCPINDILSRFDIDRLAPAVASARQALEQASSNHRRSVAALSREDLPPCPTSSDTARQWTDIADRLDRDIAQAKSNLADHSADLDASAARIATLTAGASVSDTDIAAFKYARTEAWSAHRAGMTDDTAKTFERAMTRLDTAMQSRLDQAGQLAQIREAALARSDAQARADAAQGRLSALRSEHEALMAQVAAAAAQVGLPAPTPAEWLDWVQRHETATTAAHALADQEHTHAETLARARDLIAALAPSLLLRDPDFDGALAAGRQMAKSEQAAADHATRAQEELSTLDRALKRAVATEQVAVQALQTAKSEWRALLASLSGGPLDAETLLVSLSPLRDLREQRDLYIQGAVRIDAMARDQDQFAQAVSELATACGIAPTETPAKTYDLIADHAAAVRSARTALAEIVDRLSRATSDRAARQNRLDAIAVDVATMGQVFPDGTPVQTLDALRATTTQALHVIDQRGTRDRLAAQIVTDLAAADLTHARAMLGQATVNDLEAQAAGLSADLTQAENRLTLATEARVTAEQALAQVTGDADTAELIERRATLELQIEDAALTYLELSLGHRLADEAIRRYRDAHRSGMMADTERCFSDLTQGRYGRLTTQSDGSDEVLLAVDQTGTAKRVSEMSKGTRFQLYLALRAAAHSQLVAQGTCLPFFCDDIFETFDETRTQAACRVMEQIGRSGQAIYLTHHRHVVDIARDVCDTPPIIHEI